MSATGAPSPLFSPLRIGGMEVRNRLLSTAHLTNYAQDGLPSAQHLAYWAEKAKGGIGLIITEGSLVHPSSRTPETRFIEFWREEVVAALRPVAAAVHEHGGRIVAQLNHMGMSWAPSPWQRPNGLRAHEMTRAEIAEVVEAFAVAAERARDGGLDGVEIHASHNYLIEQFLSPLTNHRTDEYGGSEAGRLRFLLEVLAAVRERVGPDFVVGARISGDQYTPGGLGLDDMLRIVGTITSAVPLDFLNVSYYRNQDHGPAGSSIVPMYVPEGRFVYLAEAVKAVTDLPVFCVNRIVDPVMAAEIVAEGRSDMVAMTRAQIADPHLARKTAEGRLDEIRPCIGINEGCLGQVMNGAASPMTCAVNPSAGHEHDPLTPAERPRRVVVVGGGIAGMEVARVAAERGHRVALHEASPDLGGQLLLAARIPGLDDMAKPVGYYRRQFELLGVDVHLGSRVTPADVPGLDADTLVVATGSRPAGWSELGLGEAPALPTTDARSALTMPVTPGLRVLVYATDQTMEALGAADRLAEAGAEVTFATPAHAVGAQVENMTRPFVLDRLRRADAVVAVLSRLERDATGRPVLHRRDAGTSLDVEKGFDLLVLALGGLADDALFHELAGHHPDTRLVGDAYAARRMVAATQHAYAVARSL